MVKNSIISLLTFSTMLVSFPCWADNANKSQNKQFILQIGIGNTAIQESIQDNRYSVNQAEQTDFINIQTNNQDSFAQGNNSLNNQISAQRSINYSGRGSYSNYQYNGRYIYNMYHRTDR
jgi:hypothetical protein